MKLEKAIEILNDCMSETEKILYPECLKAHNLSIEALIRVLNTRVEPKYSSVDPLPGED